MGAKRASQTGSFVFPEGGVPLQVTEWSQKRAFITVGVASARVVIPVGAELIELTSTEDCYIEFGDGTVVAEPIIATDASRLFVAGVQVIVVPLDGAGVPFTQIAAIRESKNGILQIEEVS